MKYILVAMMTLLTTTGSWAQNADGVAAGGDVGNPQNKEGPSTTGATVVTPAEVNISGTSPDCCGAKASPAKMQDKTAWDVIEQRKAEEAKGKTK